MRVNLNLKSNASPSHDGLSVSKVSSVPGAIFLCWGGLVLLLLLLFQSCSDGSECSSEKPCQEKTHVCIEGKCERKRCLIDEDCPGSGNVCDRITSRCKKNRPTGECRTDNECRQGEICEGGLCRLNPSEVPKQEAVPERDRDPNACSPACRKGYKCEKGQCIELEKDPPCKFDSDCKDGRKCNIAVDLCQTPCQADAMCSDGRKCLSGFCQHSSDTECSSSKPCPAPKQCVSGRCVEPECDGKKPCPSPKICEKNKCVEPECYDKKPCASPKVCRNNKCEDPPNTCDGANPCSGDRKCYKGKCQPKDYCESESDCNNQKCYKNACGACQQNSDCQSFEACKQGKCVTVEKKIGEPCKASAECVKNATCAGDRDNKKACRKICKPLDPNPGCDSGTVCGLLSILTGACFPPLPNGLKEGSDCSGANQNKCNIELTCVNQGNGKSLCMRYCNQQNNTCPNQGKCLSISMDPLGVCEIKGGSGNVKPGQKCASNAECVKGAACVAVGGGVHKVDICLTLCNPQSPSCPGGTKCVGTSAGPTVGVCQAPCSSKADCASGFCLGASGVGTCTTGCDPYQAVCDANQTCDVVPDATGALRGVCGPFNVSGLPVNGVCTVGAFACKRGLVCIAIVRNTNGNLVGRCGLPCRPGSTNCPAGTSCKRSVANLVGNVPLLGCIQ